MPSNRAINGWLDNKCAAQQPPCGTNASRKGEHYDAPSLMCTASQPVTIIVEGPAKANAGISGRIRDVLAIKVQGIEGLIDETPGPYCRRSSLASRTVPSGRVAEMSRVQARAYFTARSNSASVAQVCSRSPAGVVASVFVQFFLAQSTTRSTTVCSRARVGV